MQTTKLVNSNNLADNRDLAEKYIELHDISQILNDLTQTLLVERPENPKQFLVKTLTTMRATRVFCAYLSRYFTRTDYLGILDLLSCRYF